MADAASVAITTTETGPEAPAVVTAPVVPDKFKNADGSVNTEALLASYVELEKKQGAPAPKEGEQPAAEAGTETKDGETPPASEQEQAATEALKVAGLDISEFNTEFATDGKLSDDSYAKLEAKGFPRAAVDQFIRGAVATQADAEAAIADVKSAAGGDEGYAQMVAWAATSLKPNEQAEFNEAVSSGKPGIAKAAVQALKAKFDASEGKEPALISGNAKVTGDVFRSWQEMDTAMSDPRYGKDPAYTQSIEQKAMRSKI